MVVLRRPLVAVLFKRGAFQTADMEITALALWCYAAGLVPMAWVSTLSRAFHALRDTRTPLAASAAGLVVNVVLNFVLVRTVLRVGGLALATSISMVVTSCLMLWLLGRRLQREGVPPMLGAGEAVWWLRTAVLTAATFGVTLAVREALSRLVSGGGFFASCVELVVPAAAGLIACACGAWLLGLLSGLTGRRRPTTSRRTNR